MALALNARGELVLFGGTGNAQGGFGASQSAGLYRFRMLGDNTISMGPSFSFRRGGKGSTVYFTRCPNVKNQNLGCDIYFR